MDKKIRLKYVIIILILCIVPQCFIAMQQYPLLVGDDMGVISLPAFLSGRQWDDIWRSVAFYGGGYHILLTPLFILTNNPLIIYRGVLLSYVLLEAVIAIIAFYILRHYYQCDEVYASVLSILCSYFTYTKPTYVSNEIVLLLGLWLVILIILKLIEYGEEKRKKQLLSILLCFISSYLITIHLRSSALLIAIVFTIITYYLYKKKSLVSPIVSAVCFPLLYFAAQKFNNIVQSTIWITDGITEINNSNIIDGAENIVKLFNVQYWHAWAAIFLGQLSTVSIMSIGMLCPVFIWSLVFLYKMIRKQELRTKKNMSTAVIIILMSASIIITLGGQSITWLDHAYDSIQMGAYNSNDDPNINFARVFTYLRYFSFYTNPLLIIGLVNLKGNTKKNKKIMKWGIALYCFLQVLWFLLVFPYICNIRSVADVYIPFSIENYGIGYAGSKVYLPAIILCTAFFLLIVLLYHRKKSLMGLVILCIFVIYQYTYYGIVHENPWWDRGDGSYNLMRTYINEIPFDHIYVPYEAMAYEFQFLFNDISVNISLPDNNVEEAVIFTNLYPIEGERYWTNLENQGYQSIKIDDNEYVFIKGEKFVQWFSKILEMQQ